MADKTAELAEWQAAFDEAYALASVHQAGQPLNKLAANKLALCNASTVSNFPTPHAQGTVTGTIAAIDDLMAAYLDREAMAAEDHAKATE